MFSDDEIKESSLMRPGDELISIREVCLINKYDRRYMEPLLSNTSRSDLEVPRLFAWTEEDGNIASLISEPGFGTTGQTTFEKDFDAALNNEIKEAGTSSSSFEFLKNGITFQEKIYNSSIVSSTSTGNTTDSSAASTSQRGGRGNHKVDITDPRSRYHYVKYVKRHGRTVKLWECGICSREFQHQYTLMRHLPTHTDERNFHCDACSKSFRQLSTLSQHRAIHSADRPYACEVCNKTFNRVSTLISHRKTHSNEKPYKCHICPKGFHQKGNLRNHLFTHTNERPYRCNVCLKGFNQQSNLVCHKNKAHPDENYAQNEYKNMNNVSAPVTDTQTDFTRPTTDQCEVTSTVPYLPLEPPLLWPKPSWHVPKLESDIWNEGFWGSNGVIVDPIKTYHMGVALATKQTPFALLKSGNNTPVLVKVVDTKLPGGKQMLVPATAEDLKIGGKIILNTEEGPTASNEIKIPSPLEVNSALQIRVPVVATVVPKMKPGGGLQLSVEEPHHSYTAIANGGEEGVENLKTSASIPSTSTASLLKRLEINSFDDQNVRPGRSCTPPLDLISLDLFEPIGCIPLGPQITTVDNIDGPSNDSDIFIGKFQESIPLSDSD